jgi:hypothetical protein
MRILARQQFGHGSRDPTAGARIVLRRSLPVAPQAMTDMINRTNQVIY